MVHQIQGAVKKLCILKGPVAVGIFDDGTIILGDLADGPILIRNGALMRPDQWPIVGDITFSYEKTDG